MAEFIKLEFVDLPKACVIGRCFRVSMDATMGSDNPLPGFWSESWADGSLEKLMEVTQGMQIGDNTVGCMADWKTGDGHFSYWIGVLARAETPVPEGYERLEIAAGTVAVGSIRGADVADVCMNAHAWTEEALKKAGRTCEKMDWCCEYYGCPEFTTPDEEGSIILSYYIPCD